MNTLLQHINNIHIGKLIKSKLCERGMTVADLAIAINCERTNVYKIFQRKSIDVELLLRISCALNYNFIEEVYLVPIRTKTPIVNSNFTIEITDQQVRITPADNNKSSLIFSRRK